MDANKQEQLLKKKLQTLLSDMLKFGTVKGFKYFTMYPRGREELIINILNEPKSSSASHTNEPNTPTDVFNFNNSFTSQNLPYDTRSLLLSQRTQMNLSGYGDRGVGLPPASPSDDEHSKNEKCTAFLIAGYAKYNCPYVWVRSNHDRLVKATGTDDRDSPLKLKCSAKWKDTDYKIWDIISELIKLCTYPAPRNPFEVDLDYLDSLPLAERVLATGALTNSLQQIMLHTKDEKHYSGKVFDDLHLVTKKHFEGLQELANQRKLPALQEHLQAEQKQRLQAQRESQTQSRATQRKRYPSQTYTEQAAAAYGLQPSYGTPQVQSHSPIDQLSQYSQYGHSSYGYTQAPSMF